MAFLLWNFDTTKISVLNVPEPAATSVVSSFWNFSHLHIHVLVFFFQFPVSLVCSTIFCLYPSIHLLPSLIWSQVVWQQPKQLSPDFPVRSYYVQLFLGEPQAFTGQPRVKVSPALSCVFLRAPLPEGRTWRPHQGGIQEASWLGAWVTSSGSSQCGGAELLTLSLREPSHPSEVRTKIAQ